MDDDTLKHIYRLAERFRQAIESTDRDTRPIPLILFPHAACGEASVLLGHFLGEQGVENIEYVSGQWGRETHGWLEIEEVIADITADQFIANDEILLSSKYNFDLAPVIVTRHRLWHSQFENQRRHPAAINVYDDANQQRILNIYRAIVPHLR